MALVLFCCARLAQRRERATERRAGRVWEPELGAVDLRRVWVGFGFWTAAWGTGLGGKGGKSMGCGLARTPPGGARAVARAVGSSRPVATGAEGSVATTGAGAAAAGSGSMQAASSWARFHRIVTCVNTTKLSGLVERRLGGEADARLCLPRWEERGNHHFFYAMRPKWRASMRMTTASSTSSPGVDCSVLTVINCGEFVAASGRGGAEHRWTTAGRACEKPHVPSLVSLLNSCCPVRQTLFSGLPSSCGAPEPPRLGGRMCRSASSLRASERPPSAAPRCAALRAGAPRLRRAWQTTPRRKSTQRFQPFGALAASAASR